MTYTVEFVQGFYAEKVDKINPHFNICDLLKDMIKRDYRNIMLAYHNGIPLFYETDNMEPEDANFNRDMNWIKERLEEAYQLGFMDGKEAAK